MRNIEVKENGSMWKLATFWGQEYLPSDGCGLFWKCLFHLLLITGSTILTGIFLGDLVASTVASFAVGTLLWGPANILLGIILAFILMIVLVVTPFAIYEGAEDSSENVLMKTIYNIKTVKQGFKEKYCPLVEEV